jgi:hypothetical protein
MRLEESNDIGEPLELLTVFLASNSLLTDARVGFDGDLDDERAERASDATALRLRDCVPDMTEVVLDAIATHQASPPG